VTNRIPTNNYVNHYDKYKAHHRAFFQAVLDRVTELDPEALQPGGDLRDIWVAAVETKAPSPTPNDIVPAGSLSGAPVTWESMIELARVAGARYPELVAAQGALESDWYRKPSGTHNYFGLKGSGTTKSTQEFIDGKWITVRDGFLNFGSPKEAVEYLVSRWYKNFKSYKGVNNAPTREDAARMLKTEGYATDPKYDDSLIRIMNERAPAAKPVAAIPVQQGSSQLIVIPGADGPKKTPADFGFKPGDSPIIVNDITQEATAFDYQGKQLWKVKVLARGAGPDNEYRRRNTDTPPGIYRIGQVYKDYEQFGANPAFTATLLSYGWYSFDLVELENQEAKHGRAGIMIHGGGEACGWPGAWVPMQQLFFTHGCIRKHNIDLRDKLLPLTESGTVFVSVFQERIG
jgi:hypothetical protein